MAETDYAIVGGGLQAGLIALAVRAARPSARIAIIERGTALAGNHTWCFHAGDLPAGADWIAPITVCRWEGYDVAFPGGDQPFRRTLASPYACVTSSQLARRVGAAVDELWLGEPAIAIEPHRVATRSRELTATVVIDACGPNRFADTQRARCGWQTFVGQEVIVANHGLTRPMVMDATVDQAGDRAPAMRFVYVLPLAPDRLLIEDTAFDDAAYLDVARGRRAIADYAAARGWSLGEVIREETGVLPLPLSVDMPVPSSSPLVAGYGGGWFHPVTGYSFPIAARLAHTIASVPAAALFPALAELAGSHVAQLAFATRLNRMLFTWFAGDRRYHVLARFYRLPEAVIRRFYALELTPFDRARFFLGRPPRGLSWRAVLGKEVAR